MSDTTQIAEQQDITDLFRARLDAEPPAVDVQSEKVETDENSAPEVEESESGAEMPQAAAESVEEPEADNLQPTIPAPPGMTADEQTVFEQAEPELQAWLLRQEAARQGDYTVKSQTLAEERRQIEAQRAETGRLRDQYAEVLRGATKTELKPPPASLYDDDPDEYGRQKAIYDEQKIAQDAYQAELSRVEAEQKAERDRLLQEHQAAVRAQMPSLIPSYADPTKATAIDAEMKAYATSNGIPEQMFEQATAKEKQILWKAMQFDKGGKSARKAAPPRAQKPGAARRVGDKSAASKDRMAAAAEKTAETKDFSHIWKARIEEQERQR